VESTRGFAGVIGGKGSGRRRCSAVVVRMCVCVYGSVRQFVNGGVLCMEAEKEETRGRGVEKDKKDKKEEKTKLKLNRTQQRQTRRGGGRTPGTQRDRV
jgi:hypothetical protein